MKKININELKEINTRFLNSHYEITDEDIDRISDTIEKIENTRDNKSPKTGDIVQFTSIHGEYFENALISSIWDDGEIEICERQYVPFVLNYKKDKKDINLSVSGGSFHNFKSDMFKYIGKDDRKFCIWGHCGGCADGSIDFFANVNVWKVKQQNIFEPYTTKEYNKMYIYKNVKNHEPYTILGNGIAFETETDYEAFLKTYKAKEFPGYSQNQFVIFYYKEENYYITQGEWNNLEDCEIDTRLCNGSIITVKVQYDDTNKKIKVYRFSNRFEQDEQIADKPYILNRNLKNKRKAVN